MRILDIITILATGLMTGNELTVSLFINPVMQQLEPATQAKALSLFARLLGRVMPFWYAGCLILLIAEAVLHRGQPAFTPLLTAAILWAAIIVFTIFLLVPINNRIGTLDTTGQDPHQYSQSLTEHRRWELLHRLRILGLIIAIVLLLDGLLPA